MHRLKDSPLNQANCLERDKTKMCSASRDINSALHNPITLWISGLHTQTQTACRQFRMVGKETTRHTGASKA